MEVKCLMFERFPFFRSMRSDRNCSGSRQSFSFASFHLNIFFPRVLRSSLASQVLSQLPKGSFNSIARRSAKASHLRYFI